MAWYDNKTDFWHLIGDPGGYVSGVNTQGFGGVKNMASGDPDSVKKAYDDAMQMSMASGRETKDFLLGQQGKALAYYAPLQQMFNNAYGANGIQGPQTPQVPGSGPLTRMYGGG